MPPLNDLTSPVSGRGRLLAITMGCPVGIGPEIILRFMAAAKFPLHYLPVIVGDIGVLERVAEELRFNCNIVAWRPGKPFEPQKIQVVPPRDGQGGLEPGRLGWGRPDRETGRAAAAYIREAVQLVNENVAAALVTCPIAKYAMQLAGCEFPGHTEMLASFYQTHNFGMMLAGERLKVSLVTIHSPLAEVAVQLTRAEVKRIIRLTGNTLLQDFAISRPRIGVAGLNPHAGESGLFGEEERRIIVPAVESAASERWELSGPLPPDTVFKMAYDGQFDAVVAMYHDQGLIPFKMVHFADGVNFTMGLPIVRTSVDHGTAYDIAGKGLASESSLAAAFAMAARISENRQRGRQGRDKTFQAADKYLA